MGHIDELGKELASWQEEKKWARESPERWKGRSGLAKITASCSTPNSVSKYLKAFV